MEETNSSVEKVNKELAELKKENVLLKKNLQSMEIAMQDAAGLAEINIKNI